MNTPLAAQLVAKDAELQELRDGMESLISYLRSPKFRCGDSLDGYVQINDVINSLRQTRSNSFDAGDAALANELGPKPEASPHGWRCPECQEPLQSFPNGIYRDTDEKAQQRMRQHWVATHKVVA